jgi:two-component system phosphate regulon sensor histidine kinase PhoR
MRERVFWRIFIPLMGLIFLTLLGVTLYLSSLFYQNNLQRMQTYLLQEARLVRNLIMPFILEDPESPQINQIVQDSAMLVGERITVVLADGRVVGESEKPLNQLENHLSRPEVQEALRNREATEIRFSTTVNEEMLYVAIPVVSQQRVVAVVRMAASMQSIRREQQALNHSLFIAAIIAGGFAVLIAVWITRRVLAPLESLSATAQQLTERTGEPARGEGDEIRRLQAAFQTMSEHLREQVSQLRAERQKLQTVLRNMRDGILLVDETGKILLINSAAAEMFGIEESRAVGASLIEGVRHHAIVELWERARQGHTPQDGEVEILPEHRFLQVVLTPLGRESENAFLLVFHDLTRERRVDRVRRDFVSNVSHELRTPLASLKALVETLQEGALDDPPAAQRFLRQMEVEIDNLTQMVRELLELSRIESGLVPLQRKVVSPCDILRRGAERMRLQAERAGLTLQIDCPEDIPQVLADADRVEQVLVNLIHNAIKFTSPGGLITLSVKQEGNSVTFSVRDTGIGIPPDDLERIFERFYKADRSRSGEGTGLGLSIARHIVEAHGGRIWAESQVQQGSTFFFTLPLER